MQILDIATCDPAYAAEIERQAEEEFAESERLEAIYAAERAGREKRRAQHEADIAETKRRWALMDRSPAEQIAIDDAEIQRRANEQDDIYAASLPPHFQPEFQRIRALEDGREARQ